MHRSGSLTASGEQAAVALPWTRPVKRLKYGVIFLGQFLLWGLLYYSINDGTAGRSVAQPLLPFETRIPLVSAAYPIYALVYVQVFLPLVLSPTRLHYVTTHVAIALASLVGFTVFLLAPMSYPRPVLSGDGIFDAMLALEFATDGTRCTLPSLHVAVATILYRAHRERPFWGRVLLVSALAIGVSTVLVKQHFIVDGISGAILGAACWPLAARLTRRLLRSPVAAS